MEPPGRGRHRDGGEVSEGGWYHGGAVGGRGVPLPHQAHDEGSSHWGGRLPGIRTTGQYVTGLYSYVQT